MAENETTTPLQKFLRRARPLFMLVGVGILVYLARKIGWEQFKSIVIDMKWGWIAIALVCWVLNLSFASLRFRSLAAPGVGFFRVFEIVIVSYLMNYATMVQGMSVGAKVGMLKGERVPVSKSLAGAGAEVLFDLILTSIIVVAFSIYAGIAKQELDHLSLLPLLIGGLLGLAILAAMILLRNRVAFFHGFVEGLKSAFAPGRFPPNMLFTIGVWTMAGASFYCVLKSIGADLSYAHSLAAISAGLAVGLVSLVPGGLGVRDFTWAYVCSLGGVPMEKAVAASLIMRFIYIASVAVMVGVWGIVKRKAEAAS